MNDSSEKAKGPLRSNSLSNRRMFPLPILGKRSQSVPTQSNNDNTITKERRVSNKGGFRFVLPQLTKRSRSMPVQSVTTCCPQPQQHDEPQRLGRKRTRAAFDLLKRSASVVLKRVDSISKGSKSSRESATDVSNLSDDDVPGKSLVERTKVVAFSPKSVDNPAEFKENEESLKFDCATAILQHSYLEHICGSPRLSNCIYQELNLPEDPTVQESIECIFASQLEDGLNLWEEEDEGVALFQRPTELPSPLVVQQPRVNRSKRISTHQSQSRKRYQQAKLVYVGTYDPNIPHDEQQMEEMEEILSPLPCPCAHSSLPALNPKDWPQAPLLLRPTPGSGTRIRGVRLEKEEEYIWEPGSHLSWSERLAQKWGKVYESSPRVGCCENCAILPINNGNERPGECLVTDFETDLFEGTLLLRLRHAEGTTPEPYDDTKGYFRGLNRRYQALVRGRFKKSIPLTELVTGFKFNRRLGKLPPKWILRGALKVLSFFAPQLDAKYDGSRPHSLTPLGSTPQSIAVDREASDLLGGVREEPVDGNRTLLGESSLGTKCTSIQRAKARKKKFDKLYVAKAQDPKTDVSKTYTFEFLQHLLNFQEFSIELGSMLGSVQLEQLLDGQPLQVMASYGEQSLWSFDVWHECLWEKARQHTFN